MRRNRGNKEVVTIQGMRFITIRYSFLSYEQRRVIMRMIMMIERKKAKVGGESLRSPNALERKQKRMNGK
jgi:hypothetical protein